MQAVEVVVAAGEGAGPAQIGVHDLHGHTRRIHAAPGGRSRVLEAVNRVARLEDLAGPAGDDLVALHEQDGGPPGR